MVHVMRHAEANQAGSRSNEVPSRRGVEAKLWAVGTSRRTAYDTSPVASGQGSTNARDTLGFWAIKRQVPETGSPTPCWSATHKGSSAPTHPIRAVA